MSQPSPTQYAAFGIVFNQGQAVPSFKGVTQIPLVSEAALRQVVRETFPNVRKAAFSLLGVARSEIPEFFIKAGGKFMFPLTQPKPETHPTEMRAIRDRKLERPKPKAKSKVKSKANTTSKQLSEPRGKTRASGHSKKPNTKKTVQKAKSKARK